MVILISKTLLLGLPFYKQEEQTMRKTLLFLTILLCCIGGLVLSKVNQSSIEHSGENFTYDHKLESDDISNTILTESQKSTNPHQYCKYIVVPATDQMPALCFEITGRMESDNLYETFYYPIKIVITAGETVIQQLDFHEDDFAPCNLDDFGFEYGNFRFDGYGGFKLLSTSLGKNPSYYVWVWDENEKSFREYPDLEMVGYITFDYNNQQIKVSSSGGNAYHEFLTYEYINDKLTLIEKAIDADDYRKVYKLKDGEMKLIETIESQLK